MVAAYVAAGNSGAAALGDLSLAAAVTLALGTPVAPLGIARPSSDPDRLTGATRAIFDDLDRNSAVDPEAALATARMRFLRLAEAEIHQAVAQAYDAAVKASGYVTGWTRGLEPKACQLCRWWWRNGRVWAADHPFPRHTGCDCSQVIVTN